MPLPTNPDQSPMNPQWEADFAELARRSCLEPLPRAARQQIMTQFKHAQRTNIVHSLWQTISAALSYDSRDNLLPAGARTTRMTEGRQLIFDSEQGDIALDIQPKGGSHVVNGQLLVADSEQPHLIQLVAADSEVASTVSDDIGEFTLPDVLDGEYQMVISASGYEVVIESLSLQ